ncbi:MAG: SLBB domain-containing protein [Prevotellaceae bacterium]|nr:SLBB domain-containing protein [Prevotellaceae bacterium]
MHRLFTMTLCLFIFTALAVTQGISDAQVMQYVQQAQQQGLSQTQMAADLMRRGVTREQVERLKKQYDEMQKGSTTSNSQTGSSRMRNLPSTASSRRINAGLSTSLTQPGDSLVENDSLQMLPPKMPGKLIYGHNFFNNQALTFEPNLNIATPVDYRLGPGDEVIIDIWGDSQSTIRQIITPEGNIIIDNLGPVYLNGMTVDQAKAYLQKALSRIYSTISDSGTQIQLSLGQTRTISVNVMGEVVVPGTYQLSAFATLFHALYSAGGVTEIGSLRAVKVMRDGKQTASVDVYSYMMNGKQTDNIRLQEGDVIMVPTYQALVNIGGKVKRPMFYEVRKGETVRDVLDYAGGFTGDAYTKAVRVIRLSGREKQIYNVDDARYADFDLADADSIAVDSVLDRFENKVEILGAVYRPGLYQLGEDVQTVKQLIAKAEGLKGDAFTNRVELQREHEDLTLEVIPIDLRGDYPDIRLQKNDLLYIPSIHDLQEQQTLTIRGFVARAGTYLYAKQMSIEDLIVQAGGLLEAASTARIDVSRRIKQPEAVSSENALAKSFSFEMKNGMIPGGETFFLEPFDEVYVRRSPAYAAQENVYITGEVLFGGPYALKKKNQRLSELVADAGGLTPDAFQKGARLIRKRTEIEMKREEDALRMAQRSAKDSIDVELLNISPTYTVGIDLEKALSVGGEYDVVLHEGDSLYVPELISTVKISGAVMYPNTVTYKPGEKLGYYIDMAGGFGEEAKKGKAYIVYMNGTVARASRYRASVIQPGCEIIVPTKENRNPVSVTQMVTLGTSVATMGAVIMSLINSLK